MRETNRHKDGITEVGSEDLFYMEWSVRISLKILLAFFMEEKNEVLGLNEKNRNQHTETAYTFSVTM